MKNLFTLLTLLTLLCFAGTTLAQDASLVARNLADQIGYRYQVEDTKPWPIIGSHLATFPKPTHPVLSDVTPQQNASMPSAETPAVTGILPRIVPFQALYPTTPIDCAMIRWADPGATSIPTRSPDSTVDPNMPINNPGQPCPRSPKLSWDNK